MKKRHFYITEEQLKRFSKMLIENLEDEGINFRTDKKTGNKVAYYKPEKFNKVFDTHMFQKQNDGTMGFKAVVKYLPKTHVKTINLFNNLQPKFSKLFKHSTDEKGNEVIQDKSMNTLYNKMFMYLTYLIRQNMPDVDYILIPKSSSDLNTTIANELNKRLGGDASYQYFIPDIFVKNVQTIELDNDWLNNRANDTDKLTPEECEALLRRIHKWKEIDEPIRGFRRVIERLEKEIQDIKLAKQEKRGRPSKEITDRQEQIAANKKAIASLRKGTGAKGKDSTIDADGTVKDWQIKGLEDKIRKALIGFMQINPQKLTLVSKFKGKKIVIFDDNISSGATMDDCCLALQKIGVNLQDILVLTLGVMDPTTYKKSERTDSRIEP